MRAGGTGVGSRGPPQVAAVRHLPEARLRRLAHRLHRDECPRPLTRALMTEYRARYQQPVSHESTEPFAEVGPSQAQARRHRQQRGSFCS